ncbi:MAG: protein kinase [Deltaproteobacteria bacterium]|nr:protein kinase [Deltaproteobacteria bacterium]
MAESDIDPAVQARVGTVLGGKYRLRRVVGVGGMGAVYEARNTWTDRRVALKVLHPELARKKIVVQRFLREARAATSIPHPNIVDILDMGEDPDASLYLVQEFLVGTDLRRLLDELKTLSPKEALDIVLPIAGALAMAHDRGVIHRDLKPDNIFLSLGPDGRVVPKVIDFGIVKVRDKNEGPNLAMTRVGIAVGTPRYMSPEQACSNRDLDARSDVWSLAVVLYESLAGRCPFEGENYNALIARIATEKAPALDRFCPEAPPLLVAVLARALETDRDLRYPTMQAFREALVPVLPENEAAQERASLPTFGPRANAIQALARTGALAAYVPEGPALPPAAQAVGSDGGSDSTTGVRAVVVPPKSAPGAPTALEVASVVTPMPRAPPEPPAPVSVPEAIAPEAAPAAPVASAAPAPSLRPGALAPPPIALKAPSGDVPVLPKIPLRPWRFAATGAALLALCLGVVFLQARPPAAARVPLRATEPTVTPVLAGTVGSTEAPTPTVIQVPAVPQAWAEPPQAALVVEDASGVAPTEAPLTAENPTVEGPAPAEPVAEMLLTPEEVQGPDPEVSPAIQAPVRVASRSRRGARHRGPAAAGAAVRRTRNNAPILPP